MLELRIDNIYFSSSCLRKSGCIVTIFKKSLANLLEFPDTSSEYVQWVKIDSSIFGTDKNVLLGNIYIPPENTKNEVIKMLELRFDNIYFSSSNSTFFNTA
jgi:hypothetical protein